MSWHGAGGNATSANEADRIKELKVAVALKPVREHLGGVRLGQQVG
jgi:hypothetical protein